MKLTQDKSRHHALLGHMMMEGSDMRNSSCAQVWVYKFRHRACFGNRPYTAMGRLLPYLQEQGFTLRESKTTVHGMARTVTHIYELEEEEEFHIKEWIMNDKPKVDEVLIYPKGPRGPRPLQISISDVAQAMSWGMA